LDFVLTAVFTVFLAIGRAGRLAVAVAVLVRDREDLAFVGAGFLAIVAAGFLAEELAASA